MRTTPMMPHCNRIWHVRPPFSGSGNLLRFVARTLVFAAPRLISVLLYHHHSRNPRTIRNQTARARHTGRNSGQPIHGCTKHAPCFDEQTPPQLSQIVNTAGKSLLFLTSQTFRHEQNHQSPLPGSHGQAHSPAPRVEFRTVEHPRKIAVNTLRHLLLESGTGHVATMPDQRDQGKIASLQEIRLDSPTPGEVLQQLDLILSSEFFAPHSTLADLLRAIVTESLAGHTESLKEITLATDVLGRKNYDTQKDSTVRVSVNTIRRKLSEFYEKNAQQSLVRIDIPRGHYKATFSHLRRQTEKPAPAAIPAKRNRYLLLTAILAAAAALAVAGVIPLFHFQPTPSGIPEQITFDASYTSQPAVSRDGSVLVYSSDRGPQGNINIWVREGDKEPRQLTNGPASDFTPDVSPDGTQVVFRSWRKPAGIWAVSTKGGTPKLLAANAYSPRFSPDGKWIAFTSTDPEGVFTIPSSGGAPKRLDPGIDEAQCPVWSPDGNSVVFVAHDLKNNTNDLWVAPAFGQANQQPHPLGVQARLLAQKLPPIPSVQDCPQDSLGNHLLFLTSQNATNLLLQVPFALTGSIGKIEQVAQTASADHTPYASFAAAIHSYLAENFARLISGEQIWTAPFHRPNGPATAHFRLASEALGPLSLEMAARWLLSQTASINPRSASKTYAPAASGSSTSTQRLSARSSLIALAAL